MKKLYRFLICGLLLLGFSFFLPSEAKADGAGNYYIKVNLGTNVTTVYKNDGTPYRAMICSVGDGTQPGTYYTPVKYRWKELIGPSYGQYSTRIYGGVLFHSVYYWTNGDKSSMHTEAYNLLGTTQSHGCIRLLMKDCKWIYDNCPIGTKVVIFKGSSKDDPLGKPALMRINNGKYTNWDPTDPDPANPWRSAKPSITVTDNRVVQYKSQFDPLAAITATDSLGNNAINQVKVKGKVRTNKVGSYRIVYRLKDGLGRVATKKVKFTVKDTFGPQFKGLKNQSIALGQSINLRKGVSAKTLAGKSYTNQIKINYKSDTSTKYKLCKNGKFTPKAAGTYTIRYSVRGKNKAVTINYITLTVLDKRLTIAGPSTVAIEYGTKFKIPSYVTLKNTSGKTISKKNRLTYTGMVHTRKLGSYTITYTAMIKNKPYTKRTKKITFKVVNEQTPTLTAGNTLPQNVTAKSETINFLEGASAQSATGVKLTSKITVHINGVQIANPKSYTFDKGGSYNVVYQVSVPGGTKIASVVKTINVTDPTATEPTTTAPAVTQPTTQPATEPTTTQPAAETTTH